MRAYVFTILISLLCFSSHSIAQKGVTTLGIQVKPIVPNKFLDAGDVFAENDGVEALWKRRVSASFGVVIRQGFTNTFSVETGINLLRRNFDLQISNPSVPVTSSLEFSFISYEIPIQGLIYVRLTERWWMNGSGGISLDFFPSNTVSNNTEQNDSLFYDFEQFTARRNWVQIALLANYGFEYRTPKKGYYYIGASYHRPFNDFAESLASYTLQPDATVNVITGLSGSYFTVDLRYFFHEKPVR